MPSLTLTRGEFSQSDSERLIVEGSKRREREFLLRERLAGTYENFRAKTVPSISAGTGFSSNRLFSTTPNIVGGNHPARSLLTCSSAT